MLVVNKRLFDDWTSLDLPREFTMSGGGPLGEGDRIDFPLPLLHHSVPIRPASILLGGGKLDGEKCLPVWLRSSV